MNLMEKACRVQYAGENQPVIEDSVLLEWAQEQGEPPMKVQRMALENGIIPLRYLKNLWTFNLSEQQTICDSKVLICGCGGLGGHIIQLLARVGVGYLRLVDNDIFHPSNLNRQWACDTQNMFRPKVLVASELAQAINPLIHIDPHQQLLEDHCAEGLVKGMDLVLDALDNIETRFVVSQWTSRLGIPFIHGAAAGWWGQISTFIPGSDSNLANIYGKRRSRDSAEEALGVLGPTAAVIGSLQAMEAVRVLTGREPAYAEKLFYFDGESGQSEIIPLQ